MKKVKVLGTRTTTNGNIRALTEELETGAIDTYWINSSDTEIKSGSVGYLIEEKIEDRKFVNFYI